MKKLIFIACALLSGVSYAQIGQKCPVCPPSLNGVPSGYVLTDSSGHAKWKAIPSSDTSGLWSSDGSKMYQTNSALPVGIGNTSPTHTLELGTGGVLNATFFQTIGSDGNDFVIYSYPQDADIFRINGDDNKIYFDEGGVGFDLGIGVSNPNVTLDVTGDFQFVTGNQGAGKVWTSDADGFCDWADVTGVAWGLTGNAGTDPSSNFIGTTDNDVLVFKVNNNQYGYLDNGNDVVGFGYKAVEGNAGNDVNSIGLNSAKGNTGNDVNAMGHNSANGNIGDDVIAIGHLAGINNVFDSVLVLGHEAQAIESNQISFSPAYHSIIANLNGQTAGYVLTTNGTTADWQGAVYGSYYDTTNQVNHSTTSAIYALCNTTLEQSGVTKTNDSTFTISQTGVYQIYFSAQTTKTDGGVDAIRFWLRVNGADVPFTSGDIELSTTNSTHVASQSYTRTLTSGDTVNIMWQSDDADMSLQKIARGTTPNTPASPSIVITINKIK